MTRAEELRDALDNLHFTRKYYFGVLAEMEQTGYGFGPTYKAVEKNIHTINHNITRLEAELEKEEKREFEEAEQFCFFRAKTYKGGIKI